MINVRQKWAEDGRNEENLQMFQNKTKLFRFR